MEKPDIPQGKETLEITTSSQKTSPGWFGSLRTSSDRPLTLEIKPLTIFIGPQGSGKSLLSQMLYFLRNWPFILATYGEEGSPETLVRSVVERLRSGRRAIAGAFVEGGTHQISLSIGKQQWGISLNPKNRKISPVGQMTKEIKEWVTSPTWRARSARRAVFIPAERSFFSRFINTPEAKTLYSDYLPLTMNDFSRVLAEAGEAMLSRSPDQWPKTASFLYEQMSNTLRGEPQLSRRGPYARQWQWSLPGKRKSFEIEMAASGQMAGWPLYQVLIGAFMSPEQYPTGFSFHVEEPEIHLHPRAQRKASEALIYMVNQGYKVVITTHSLTVLRTVSAAMQRSIHTASTDPHGSLSLSPEKVAAFYLDEQIRPLVSKGYIAENEIGSIDDDLGSELYTLWYGTTPDKEDAQNV